MVMPRDDTPWWKRAVIYQIYPRSFKDSNDDGIGDLPGIIGKLDYIKELGVDAIWLSPIYKSPNKDFGYDVSSYYDVNQEFGTLDDAKMLIREAKKRGLRVIMDIVLNHTSDQHPWFLASRDPTSPYRDYYIWRKGKKNLFGVERPPNNWTSSFTGPAWEKDSTSGEYYLHLFTKEQPDLNYRNPKVIDEAKKIMAYWAALGVEGFRCDVINLLYKESLKDGRWRIMGGGREHYTSTKGGHALLKEIHRDVLKPLSLFTVGEAAYVTMKEAKKFTSGDELDTIFSFEHVDHTAKLRTPTGNLIYELVRWQRGLPWNTLFLENHDQPRSISTYGDVRNHPVASAKALATLLLTLRGTPFIYQGQEIGMTNLPFSDIKQSKDPVAMFVFSLARKLYVPKNAAIKLAYRFGRDNARTPMQWTGGAHAGFSAKTPWLIVNKNHRRINVAQQQQDDASVLAFYKDLLMIRAHSKVLQEGDITFHHDKKKLLIFTRQLGKKKATVFINLSKRARTVPRELQKEGRVILSTHHRDRLHGSPALEPYEALIIE